MNRETNVSNWSTQIFLWETQMKDLLETRRPPATSPAASRKTSHAEQGQDSTSVPPIRVTKSTRRLIDDGEHCDALCVNAFHHWNRQFKRWEAIIEFAFQHPVPEGAPIPMHVRLGDDPAAPAMPDHHWLFGLTLKLGSIDCVDLSVLKGHYFNVTVKTIRKPQNERVDRPPEQWYSRVSRMSLSESFFEMEVQEALEQAERE